MSNTTAYTARDAIDAAVRRHGWTPDTERNTRADCSTWNYRDPNAHNAQSYRLEVHWLDRGHGHRLPTSVRSANLSHSLYTRLLGDILYQDPRKLPTVLEWLDTVTRETDAGRTAAEVDLAFKRMSLNGRSL